MSNHLTNMLHLCSSRGIRFGLRKRTEIFWSPSSLCNLRFPFSWAQPASATLASPSQGLCTCCSLPGEFFPKLVLSALLSSGFFSTLLTCCLLRETFPALLSSIPYQTRSIPLPSLVFFRALATTSYGMQFSNLSGCLPPSLEDLTQLPETETVFFLTAASQYVAP